MHNLDYWTGGATFIPRTSASAKSGTPTAMESTTGPRVKQQDAFDLERKKWNSKKGQDAAITRDRILPEFLSLQMNLS